MGGDRGACGIGRIVPGARGAGGGAAAAAGGGDRGRRRGVRRARGSAGAGGASGAADHPAVRTEPDVYPTVLAREVVPAPRPVEAVEGPAPDVTELLDALASEIAHEYRRYYGE